MRFLYGHVNNGFHYIDITYVILHSCVTPTGICVPATDKMRCELLGYDPFPNIVKHIVVVEENGVSHVYTTSKEIYIPFVTGCTSPRVWWNTTGRFLESPVEKLSQLQKRLNLDTRDDNGFQMEYPEQLLCMTYIKPQDCVLEIGGNIGRTALIINTILDHPDQHVVIECDKNTAAQLRHNLDLNGYTSVRIETAILSSSSSAWRQNESGCVVPSEDVTESTLSTISYHELCQKYALTFDVLVADCEGSLYYIFRDQPHMLDHIHTILMENDYTDISHKEAVDAHLHNKGFTRVYTERGVPWASWSCCFENFYEVWKRL